MNKALNLNTAAMFAISLLLAYATATFMADQGVAVASDWGFILGRAIAGVVFPFAIVFLPLLLIRRGKPKFTKGSYITWWLVFILFSVMAVLGNLLSAVNPQ